MKKVFPFSFILLLAASSFAQQVRPASSTQIYHEIAQLKNLTNVLYFAAHPDDENTRLLAWLVNDKNIRTAYMSLTRGDGGQNILGSEQGPALGLIRTHELMEARKLDGAEQFFSRAIDFGFSKSHEETFKHWNADLLTHDAVWVIRKYRPDVIICRFPPNKQAGHGQHAASAIIAAKAFEAAGDKTKYPEELAYYKAWQPKRLLFNAFKFGSMNTTTEDMYKLKVGQYDPFLGMGVGELAGISRSVHKSQGAGTPSVPGVQTEYFKVVEGDSISASMFDGIDITWGRVNRPEIGDEIQDILDQYNFRHPEKSLPALLKLRKEVMTVKNNFWREQKLAELDAIILHSTGIMAEVYTNQPEATAGETLPFTMNVIARSSVAVALNKINWHGETSDAVTGLTRDSLTTFTHKITIPQNTPMTEPYWLSHSPMDAGHYTIPIDTLLGLPEAPDNLNAVLYLTIGDENFALDVPISYKKLDPIKGDVVEALRIVPDASVGFTSDLMITKADGSLQAPVHIHTNKDLNNATLTVANKQFKKSVAGINLKQGIDTTIVVTLTAADLNTNNDEGDSLFAFLQANGKTYDHTQHLIQYSHLPTLQYFTDASAKLLHPDWQCKVKRIGYIEGAGDKVADVLRLTGLQVDILKASDINTNKLKQYDAILVGVRAVNVDKQMPEWMPELLRYVKNGGTLVMQYNTLQDLSTTKFGPYPFTLSPKRVTEEDAKVTYLIPQHKLLNSPNKITDKDWADWVQERGIYFADKWDSHYEALFSMHDTGEEPLQGSTLYAKYGKGNYIYTSLVFFRELPAGNTGAIRLMMNFLSAGK